MSVPVAYAKILNAIQSGRVMSKYEAAKVVPCHHRTAQRIFDRLHKEKLVSICAWERVYHQHIAVYCLKHNKRDEQKPAPITPLESTRRYRANPEKRIKEANRKRAKRLIESTHRFNAQDQIFNLIVKVAA